MFDGAFRPTETSDCHADAHPSLGHDILAPILFGLLSQQQPLRCLDPTPMHPMQAHRWKHLNTDSNSIRATALPTLSAKLYSLQARFQEIAAKREAAIEPLR